MPEIPFIDLKKRMAPYRTEVDAAVQRVLESGQYAGGEEVHAFEREWAAYTGTAYCIGIGNATDGFELVYRALGVGPGDEVIVPACGLISPAEMATACGAKAVFADVDPTTYNIDPDKLEELISPRTKAIVCVHLYGQLADVERLLAICDKYGIFLIEDCAQAHGSKLNNRMAGAYGMVGIYSFYPTKNLGAIGDAGALVTDDELLAVRLRELANHGQSDKNYHLTEGRNSRLDSLQAAILRTKLPYLEKENARRIQHAGVYDAFLHDLKLARPLYFSDGRHVYHLYVIRVQSRDALQDYLEQKGVGTEVHYPVPVPWQPAYDHLTADRERLEGARSSVNTLLSLPIGPEISSDQVRYIAGLVRAFFKA